MFMPINIWLLIVFNIYSLKYNVKYKNDYSNY